MFDYGYREMKCVWLWLQGDEMCLTMVTWRSNVFGT